MSAGGTVYLLHFERPYKHARHYIGWTTGDVTRRLRQHRNGTGARLLQVITAAGIDFVLARTWNGGRNLERSLKNRGGASRSCPLCGITPRVTGWTPPQNQTRHRRTPCLTRSTSCPPPARVTGSSASPRACSPAPPSPAATASNPSPRSLATFRENTMPSPSNYAERLESAAQIGILLLIGGMAGAVSFTHVHDWTMQHVPAGTGDWFGWTNAIISELTPTAAGLEIRRRKRNGTSIAYPMAVLIAAAALSIAAQLAVAKPSPSGWLLNVIPALAFLALTKLALSSTPATKTPRDHHATAPDEPANHPITTMTAHMPHAEVPAIETVTAEPATAIPDDLLQGARMAVFAHRQRSDQPITAPILAEHLGITTDVAAAVLHHLDDPHHGGRP